MKTAFLLSMWGSALSLPVAAQGVKLGLKVGVSRSQLIGDEREVMEAIYRTPQQAITGLYAGVSLQLPIRRSSHFSFHPELVYLQRGVSFDSGREQYRERNQYVELPLLVRFTQQGFFAEVGPQVGYFLHTNINMTDDYGYQTAYSAAVHADFNFALGATVGVGYALASGPSVGVRYTASTGRYTSSGVLAGYLGYTFGSRRSSKGGGVGSSAG